jgi:hypothetical protein
MEWENEILAKNQISWSCGVMTSASGHLSCYSDGLMGYQTPNIDRIAKDLPNYAKKAEKQQTTMLVELHQPSITIRC